MWLPHKGELIPMPPTSRYRIEVLNIYSFEFDTSVKRMTIGPVRLRATENVRDQADPHDVAASFDVIASTDLDASREGSIVLDKACALLDYVYLLDGGHDTSPGSLRELELLASGRPVGKGAVKLYTHGPTADGILVPSIVLSRHTKEIGLRSHQVPELVKILFTDNSIYDQSVTRSCIAGLARLHESIRSDMKGNGRDRSFLTAIMGLEALFSPESPDDFHPVSSTVALGAAYANTTCISGDDRMARWREVKALYGLRSRITHGGKGRSLSEKDVVRTRLFLAESIEYSVAHINEISQVGGFGPWLEHRGLDGS
jgi:hypothetical protein